MSFDHKINPVKVSITITIKLEKSGDIGMAVVLDLGNIIVK